jgi:hypothetical protein
MAGLWPVYAKDIIFNRMAHADRGSAGERGGHTSGSAISQPSVEVVGPILIYVYVLRSAAD